MARVLRLGSPSSSLTDAFKERGHRRRDDRPRFVEPVPSREDAHHPRRAGAGDDAWSGIVASRSAFALVRRAQSSSRVGSSSGAIER